MQLRDLAYRSQLADWPLLSVCVVKRLLPYRYHYVWKAQCSMCYSLRLWSKA